VAGSDQGWDDEFAGVLNRCKQVLLTAEASMTVDVSNSGGENPAAVFVDTEFAFTFRGNIWKYLTHLNHLF
jgi:hypothetical protein